VRDPIIGIDLGTSNTVVAHVDSTGKPVVLADENNYKIHPSVVSFHPNGGVVVGAAAKQRKVIDPQNTIYSVKRLIGRAFRSPEVKTAMQRSPFAIKEGPQGEPLIVTRAGEFAVPEISGIVLDYARGIAAERLNSVSVNRAVVTVPASFNDAQRSATATAGSIANLDIVRVINEPTAAALAYGNTKNLNQIIAVYDFGGGTFDITILKLADQIYEVLGTAGDTFLGGDDLDERVVDRMVAKFLTEQRIDLRTNEVSMMRLRAVAEQTKIELSRRSRAVVRIDEIAYGPNGKPLNLNIEITRGEFVTQVSDIIDRTFPVCQEALALAGLGIDQINDVILVGGTTKIPYVREQVTKFFSKAPRTDVNPEDAVAIGASLQAAALHTTLGKSVAVAAFPQEETDDNLTAVSRSAPTMVPSELATGAPRVKRPTAGYQTTPGPKPDTSYAVTRSGTRDIVGKDGQPVTPPAAQPLGRMTKTLQPNEVPVQTPPPLPGKATAPGMGAAKPRAATPPPIPVKHGTMRVPITPRPPATTTPTAPLPPVVPPSAPQSQPTMPRTITSEASSSFSGEIDTSPGTLAVGGSTHPNLVLPPKPPPPPADEEPTGRAASESFSSQPDSFTDADALIPTKAPSSFSDDDQFVPQEVSFSDADQYRDREESTFSGDFGTQERANPLAPPAPAVPVASPNARTMIAAPPLAPLAIAAEEPAAASTAKGFQAPAQMPRPVYPAAPIPDPPPPPAPIVLEVTPRGLGIGTVGGYCEELIRRNSRLPTAQKRLFTTARDSQDLVRIVVCQGESRRMDNNTIIGDLILDNLPRRPRGETSIEVTFHLDVSGILQVRARDAQTGAEQNATLDLVGGIAQQNVAASRDRIAALRR
jgi:molecular chaperone DnaK